jgi:hypothetical protein
MTNLVQLATEGLTKQYGEILSNLPNKQNSNIIAVYINAAKHETTSFSDNYRKLTIKVLSWLSNFCKNKNFKSMNRDEDILPFLDSHKKSETIDPLHKWIGTYNIYSIIIIKFFKWLYHPDDAPRARPKPKVVQNIVNLKRKEISCYKPTDLWTPEDDALFLKYCPSKRMKCYHMVSRDTSGRPGEILKVKIKDLVFKMTPDKKQYCEVLLNEKTGSRQTALFDSIPYVKDYLDHEHPMPGNPKAPFISGETPQSIGRPLQPSSLRSVYEDYKQRFFPGLLNKPDVLPEDKPKIRELLRKPWNPYVRRHTGLTEKSLKIPGLLNQYAGWKSGSTMPQKYLHYFGNESNKGLLQAYGIMSKDQIVDNTLKPKICPNCSEPNKPDSKFCAKCRMVLTYDAYNETAESQKEKESEVENLKNQMRFLEESQREILECLKHPEKLAQIAREG